ncbi:MAG: hypothetical protein M1830_010730 [Pleopsidium flavum]|nr:MAG: hypothetical protein M1830_010730 [Pleopsidium flavum]
MTTESRKYLATTVLNDERSVTYRALSRGLKVHSNVAKEMLYEFHRQQTAKKPGSVHATYLVSGTKRRIASTEYGDVHSKVAEDEYMQSSPFMSSSVPHHDNMNEPVSTRSIALVREEDLEGVKAQFEGVDFIHIYSLQPGALKDLQVLSDLNREIYDKYASEDPLKCGTQYGVIQNSNVKRRTGQRLVLPSEPAITAPKKSSEATKRTQSTKPQTAIKDMRALAPSPKDTSDDGHAGTKAETLTDSSEKSDRKRAGKPPSLRPDQSRIFKSFSKSKGNLKKEDTDSSVAASPTISAVDLVDPSGPEDEPMKDASEDEQEDDFAIASKRDESEPNPNPKARREEKLRKMMDEDAEPMADLGEAPPDGGGTERLSDTAAVAAKGVKEPYAVASGLRRRGRRRIMKKKTIKDEEGYLVTKEEPVWESFSEDEPEPHKTNTPASTASSLGKGKKANAKPGQGNIMSFFTKN